MKLPGLLDDSNDAPAVEVLACYYGRGHTHREFNGAWLTPG